MVRTALLLLLFTAAPSSALAQTPLGRTLHPPDRTSQTTGQTPRSGGGTPVSAAADPLWNGALIGAGLGVASGLVLCNLTEPWENCRDDVGPMLRFAAVGAGIGVAIDALIRRRKPTAASSSGSTMLFAAPVVASRGGGLAISISF